MKVGIVGSGFVGSAAAYALVTAPDFFPSCDQRQLTAWTDGNTVPAAIRNQIWNIPPDSLWKERGKDSLAVSLGLS